MVVDRIVDRAGVRQRAGMRGGCTPPGLGAADLGEYQGLSGCRRLVGNGAEAGRVMNAFEIGEKDVGAADVEEPVEIVVRFEADLVAGAGLVGEAQLPRPPAAQKSEGQGAALAADCNRPALRAKWKQALFGIVKYRAEGGDQRLQRVDDPL